MPHEPTPHPARISLRDVARAVGVSHATISLALRGDPRISSARRDEVRAAALRLGYRPDPMLSSLAAYRRTRQVVPISSTVAWLNLWPDPRALRRHQEFEAYWQGALAAAAPLGYRLEEFVVTPTLAAGRLLRILQARSVHGILIPPHPHGFPLEGFDWSAFAVVRLGLSVRHPRAHVVASDQLNCATLAFERLRAAGYRRIGFVSSRRFDRDTSGNFRAGYLGACDTARPTLRHPPPLFLAEDPASADARLLRSWLRRHRPEAVISTLASLRRLLASLGVAVPADLPVAATSVLDGNFEAGIDQNAHEIGAVALRTLAGLVQQNERGIPRFYRRILVEGRWTDGASLPQAGERSGRRSSRRPATAAP